MPTRSLYNIILYNLPTIVIVVISVFIIYKYLLRTVLYMYKPQSLFGIQKKNMSTGIFVKQCGILNLYIRLVVVGTPWKWMLYNFSLKELFSGAGGTAICIQE